MSRPGIHKQRGIRLKAAPLFSGGDGRTLDRSVRIKHEEKPWLLITGVHAIDQVRVLNWKSERPDRIYIICVRLTWYFCLLRKPDLEKERRLNAAEASIQRSHERLCEGGVG